MTRLVLFPAWLHPLIGKANGKCISQKGWGQESYRVLPIFIRNCAIEITHQELASDIGTSREVVSRILKDFEARGVCEISRGRIKILDQLKLATLLKK